MDTVAKYKHRKSDGHRIYLIESNWLRINNLKKRKKGYLRYICIQC